MNFFTIYTLPPLLSSILFLFLGGSVYLNNRKSIVNITFALVCFSTFWWQFTWFILFNTQSEALAYYLVKIGYMGIIFIPIFFFHFFLSFLRKVSRFDRYLLYFSYFAGLIFEIFLLTTNYFISGFYKYFWGFYPKAGFLHPLYLLLLTIIAARGIYLLFSSLKKTKGVRPIEHLQTKYFLGALIFYTFASSDFLINYGVEFYPLGFLFILIFLGITAYAILKHYLFGIKVILTELLVGVMGVILIILPLLEKTIQMKILTTTIFLIFCIIGYLLIRYTHREVHQKEILGQAVRERTKDLEKAKDIAEKRAREIEKRKADLEHFYKLTVGRELRMIELKKRIRELEGKKEEKRGLAPNGERGR